MTPNRDVLLHQNWRCPACGQPAIPWSCPCGGEKPPGGVSENLGILPGGFFARILERPKDGAA
jgi:hypothetical protein